MNDKIRELLLQSSTEGSSDHYERDWFDPERFAEFRECASITSIIGEDGDVASDEILTHFGVEE